MEVFGFITGAACVALLVRQKAPASTTLVEFSHMIWLCTNRAISGSFAQNWGGL